MKKDFLVQSVFNQLLEISLEKISLDEILEKALEHIISIPWFKVEQKGGIFLVDEASKVLVLKTQKNLSAKIQSMCAHVPFGRCVCGRAAASGKIEYLADVDETHENRFEGIAPHGHYSVPIISGDKRLLGVFVLYLEINHANRAEERDFLLGTGHILAGIIEHKRVEESLRGAYAELRETHVQLVQAAKMSAVGMLAGGIAHDLNNGLTPVIGYLDFLMNDDTTPESMKPLLEDAKQSARRCTDVVDRLLSVSRPSRAERALIEPRKMLREYENLLQKALPTTVSVQIRCEEGINLIFGNETEILSVLINLAVNSKDALENNIGKFFVEAKNFYQSESKNKDFATGAYVLFTVTDTGKGIPPQLLHRIYEPFFTTKAKNKGTGLGLAMVFNTVKGHGGWIDVSSQEGKGTTFQIYLPVYTGAGGQAAITKMADAGSFGYLTPSKGETVLFVDDEETMRNLGVTFLKKLGYEVLLAQDGEKTLKIYSELKDKISVVLLDMTMPKMTGMSLIQQILKINPSAKIIASSGYTSEGNEKDFLQAGAKAFLLKPYTLAPLSKLLRNILDG